MPGSVTFYRFKRLTMVYFYTTIAIHDVFRYNFTLLNNSIFVL